MCQNLPKIGYLIHNKTKLGTTNENKNVLAIFFFKITKNTFESNFSKIAINIVPAISGSWTFDRN